MRSIIGTRLAERIIWTQAQLRRPEWMVFVPAVTLAAFWLGGETMLILVALGIPLLFILAGAFRFDSAPSRALIEMNGTLALRPHILAALERRIAEEAQTGGSTGCLVVQFDDTSILLDRHGRAAQAEMLARCAERICAALRSGDTVVRLEGGGFAICLGSQRKFDLENMIQLCSRLQAALSTPISIEALRIYVTCSIGFCLSDRMLKRSGPAMLDAAQIAADEAQRHGPSAIRAYSPDMARKYADRDAQRHQLQLALDTGQIVPFFQPQISTDTGALSGFEALARWQHPERGLIPPLEFLGALEEAGLSERLGEVILFNALAALVRWDKAGLRVPTVGVNFSSIELRNPKLVEKLKWELDRFDLAPERLSIEILESVVADTDNDMIVRNIAALSDLGCGIDLDDFGTGHSSIANIRRFAVRRLKIDRSFVTKVDEDRDQQKMISGILSLAEQLGMETLAEGVETPGEHAILAKLGCGHVQGFGIGKPMPFEATIDWITQYRNHQIGRPRIGSRMR